MGRPLVSLANQGVQYAIDHLKAALERPRLIDFEIAAWARTLLKALGAIPDVP